MTSQRSSSPRAKLFREGAVLDDVGLFERGFGTISEGKLVLFPEEVVFLAERGKISPDRDVDLKKYFSRKGFLQRYTVYRDLRERGYVVRSGAKYGADFRVYEKGVKPSRSGSREHSKYLVWVLDQDARLPLTTLIGINRIAHSVKKRLLLALVDKDFDVVYVQTLRATP